MKTLVIILLCLILFVLIINSELTTNDKKLLNKAKGYINNFSNTFQILNDNKITNTEMNIIEKNGIINFLKSKFDYNDIMIPKNMIYKKENNHLIFKNIKIIGINNNNNTEKKTGHYIDLIFTINNNDMFLSQNYLYGYNGTFSIIKLDQDTKLKIIPDILHISSEEKYNVEIESDSYNNTTESNEVIIPSLV